MTKTADTLMIEDVLIKSCFGSNPKLAKEYGTTEVTISFPRNGNGREIVDFISYNPRENIFKCYEIKVSLSDLRSKAKKSWYGNYNYLVVSQNLANRLSKEEWKNEVPYHVGVIVVNTDTDTDTKRKRVLIKPSFIDVDTETADMLKNSMIRSMFYKLGGDNNDNKEQVAKVCRMHKDCYTCPLNGLHCSKPDGEVEEMLKRIFEKFEEVK